MAFVVPFIDDIYITDNRCSQQLTQRGSVYDSLKHHDQVQKSCLHQIESTLASNKIEYQTVDRFGYTDDKVNWADVIITSGGDGTFLMAASKVSDRNKPIIGINSDPTKSVGHLCLPSHYTNNFDKVIESLKSGKFQWQYKQRLRITLIGEAADEDPRELNDIRYNLRGTNQFLDQDDLSQDQTSLPARGGSPSHISEHATYQQLPGPMNCRYSLPPSAGGSNVTNTTNSTSQTDISQLSEDYNAMNTTSPLSSTTVSNTEQNHVQPDTRSPSAAQNTATTLSPFASISKASGSSTSQSSTTIAQVASTQQVTNKPYKTVDGRVLHKTRQLKERALNEVFVGETLSARVSYYELSVDSSAMSKMKSSGLTVCTGTGSTSWYYNINKLTQQQVQSVLSIISDIANTNNDPSGGLHADNLELISEVTRRFNQTLTFSPSEPKMAYSIRDPVDYFSVVNGTNHNHRSYAKRIEVKSRMQNACLVLDGCQFYPFNDGSYALIEMYDEDALKTVNIDLNS